MAEGAEVGPGLAHGFNVNGVEDAEGIRLEVEDAGVIGFGAVEFLVALEYGGGDDVGLELEEDDGAGRGVQAGGEVVEAAFVFGEFVEEIELLHFGDGAVLEAGDFVAHRENADGGDFGG